MLQTLALNGSWQLTYAEGSPLSRPESFTAAAKACYRHQWEAMVPEPVHGTLLRAGQLPDCNLAMNSLQARWIEESIWIYRREFELSEMITAPGTAVWLRFAALECVAIVRINGEIAGTSRTALVPVEFDITRWVRPGVNTVIVQLESGTVACADLPAKEYGVGPLGENSKRHWLRKPQYQSGWDWNPRLQNIGILGDVSCEIAQVPHWRDGGLCATLSEDLTCGELRFRSEIVRSPGQPEQGMLRLKLPELGAASEVAVTLTEGVSTCEIKLAVPSPELWWPRGAGEQRRYEVECELDFGGVRRIWRGKTGFRTVAVDQTPHPGGGKHFILCVNGQKIFCKGGNLVPADLLYSTVSAERYRRLAELAGEANFNLLRVWGGGHYLTEVMAECCDELGLLVWHDFMFACARYPGHDADFRRQVDAEALAAVRALAAHPALVVWCGNNELEWAERDWGMCDGKVDWLDHAIFHHYLPKIVAAEAPQTFYWPSSPYSPDFRSPNDPDSGDQHPWQVSLQIPGAVDWFAYRERSDRFPNEGGVLGASSLAMLRRFLPRSEFRLFSLTWDHHDNPFAMMDCDGTQPGHTYCNFPFWLGVECEGLPLETYAVLSGILQGEGLSEYILNYRRRMFSSAAAIFWMYNDSWPVSNGWSIIDYDLHPKLAFHPVRRAFASVMAAITVTDDEVMIFGINDRLTAWQGELHYGLFDTLGGLPLDRTIPATIPANSAVCLAAFPAAAWREAGEIRHGAFVRLSEPSGQLAAQTRLLRKRFREMVWQVPQIRLERDGAAIRLVSDVFAWGVCLEVEGVQMLSDNNFDLLPGLPYWVAWPVDCALPQVKFCASTWLSGR